MRLIDADALAKFIDYGHLNNPNEKLYSENDIREMIDMMPTVDAVPLEDYKSMEQTVNKLTKAIADTVEVVRCRDCTSFYSGWCCDFGIHMDDNEFCSGGERRTDEID